MITTHILKMSCGVTVVMDFDEETAQMDCGWSPDPPFKPELFKKIAAEYKPWRNEILHGWSKRTGKKVMLIE